MRLAAQPGPRCAVRRISGRHAARRRAPALRARAARGAAGRAAARILAKRRRPEVHQDDGSAAHGSSLEPPRARARPVALPRAVAPARLGFWRGWAVAATAALGARAGRGPRPARSRRRCRSRSSPARAGLPRGHGPPLEGQRTLGPARVAPADRRAGAELRAVAAHARRQGAVGRRARHAWTRASRCPKACASACAKAAGSRSSVEPPGGSPTGRATGPVILIGPNQDLAKRAERALAAFPRMDWRALAAVALLVAPALTLSEVGHLPRCTPKRPIPTRESRRLRPLLPAWSARSRRRLRTLGFDAGPVNGDFGSKTQAALAQFQLSTSIPVSGSAG